MLKVRQFFTLAALTVVEAIRQPICLLLSTTCVLITALTPILMMHHFGEDGKLARDSGLALQLVFGLFIAGYTASSCLDKEIKRGTASAVLSKPISREIFFLAKYAGTAAVIILFSACSCITTLLGERVSEKFVYSKEVVGYITDWHTGVMLVAAPAVAYLIAGLLNYRRKKPFESNAFIWMLIMLAGVFVVCGFFKRTGHFAPYSLQMHPGIFRASILVALALMMVSAIALTLSANFSVVPTLTICGVIFVLGLVSDYMLGQKALDSAFYLFIYRILPNWQHFWTVDALRKGGSVPWGYVGRAAMYALSYSAGVLCLGMVSFSRKEIK